MEGFGTRRSHFNLIRLFFLIPKLISFKKVNGTRMRKFSKPVSFIFDFCFYFFIFAFFIILKLIYFIKNKNIINLYKLFIKKIL